MNILTLSELCLVLLATFGVTLACVVLDCYVARRADRRRWANRSLRTPYICRGD